MATNPYEAPQTIDQPPPMAEEIFVVSVDFKELAAAAEDCSRAGKFYLYAMLLTAGGIAGMSFLNDALNGILSRLLLAAAFLATLFFFVNGCILNVAGCRQFKFELPDPKLKKLYASCQRASWLKTALIIYLSMIPVVSHVAGQPSGFAVLWNVFMFLVPAIVLLINSVVTVILHFRGINELGEMLHTNVADNDATLYLFSGVPTTLIAVIALLFLQGDGHSSEPPPVLLAVVPLLLLPMFYAYMVAYQRLSEAFLTRGKTR